MTSAVTNFRARLDALITAHLEGRLPFSEFQRAYSACYIDETADVHFSPEEIDHYGAVHEKAEWTSAHPTAEERSYGWVDPGEFRVWLAFHERSKPPRGE